MKLEQVLDKKVQPRTRLTVNIHLPYARLSLVETSEKRRGLEKKVIRSLALSQAFAVFFSLICIDREPGTG